MISHVFIGITDFQRALAFYTPVLQSLDLSLKFCDAEKPWAGWVARHAPRPLLVIGHAFNGEVSTPGNGQMIALLAVDRKTVRLCHALALENGGFCEGEPGCGRSIMPIITERISAILMAISFAFAAMRLKLNFRS
jgi:catechol 2,3-dioxygenase-like lactoylglutathione lyase family enzyme